MIRTSFDFIEICRNFAYFAADSARIDEINLSTCPRFMRHRRHRRRMREQGILCSSSSILSSVFDIFGGHSASQGDMPRALPSNHQLYPERREYLLIAGEPECLPADCSTLDFGGFLWLKTETYTQDLSADVDEALVGCTCSTGYTFDSASKVCVDMDEWLVPLPESVDEHKSPRRNGGASWEF